MNQKVVNYSRGAQLLHWSNALLILIMWPLGMIMTRSSDVATKTTLYQVHVAIGLLVLVLTLIRTVWRLTVARPAIPPKLTSVQRRTVMAVHMLQYVALLALTFSGVGMLLASGLGLSITAVSPQLIVDAPATTVHHATARIFAVLLVMHIGGVMRYQFTKGDTLGRMGVHTAKGGSYDG